MLHWDVNNGIARRSWARNPGAQWAIDRAMEAEPKLTSDPQPRVRRRDFRRLS